MSARLAQVLLEYQPLIYEPPIAPSQMHQNACSNDKSTIDHWQEIWVSNIKANKERFGSFWDHAISQDFRKFEHRACIIAGSGPSLKINAHHLKERKNLPLVSCLHNFHYFEDNGIVPDYYVSLDAGPVVLEEVSEGGSRSEEEYWEMTKDRTLVAFIGSDPRLFEKWQGRVLLYAAPLPDSALDKRIDEIERVGFYMSTGGNVLGACLYFSKAILACPTTVFVGADFSFGYPVVEDGEAKRRFHSWKSKYDKSMGHTMRVTDIYGNKVHTWPSYYNFKNYFDWVAINVPGTYINSTEGGCLGAYDQGNLSVFRYQDLEKTIGQLNTHYNIERSLFDKELKEKHILY